MTIDEFRSVASSSHRPAKDLPPLLQALLCDARGDWEGGHKIAQEIRSASASWVHAYLHRKEGDIDNARYWYGKAGRAECKASLSEEWEEIARHLLEE